ncbi:ABC transporter ATP-binding protein [Ornithinimicrobium tianjinense]|uniref:ABC transporter ATP-binding protein n=1 Tax=Ornithinimicrobium tianjinense TaxID=1195761 RepID=A0A917BY49_9MICO|nr:ABC transporter ATP-binding protein [Ornithinimicrobium tianjinense]GGF59363.1 ABC transporter ATP-binding protein [Ornithinimicrobium tianjinense]
MTSTTPAGAGVGPSPTPALEVRGLSLRIGGAQILEDISFVVPTGQVVGVIGPNGAGKTTLFNLVSGVLAPTGGQVLLDGADVTGRTITQRANAGLGRTFQTSSLFPGLSVEENVRLASQVHEGGAISLVRFPRPGDPASRRARDLLGSVGLGDRLRHRAGDLPHGDKRKLEIAMLLATDPSVVLLDEPMAGVASGDVPGLTDVIRSLHRDHGCTVLMVEHHMEVLLGLVERVAVLHFGHLLAIDTPEAVMADPTVQSAYLGEPA